MEKGRIALNAETALDNDSYSVRGLPPRVTNYVAEEEDEYRQSHWYFVSSRQVLVQVELSKTLPPPQTLEGSARSRCSDVGPDPRGISAVASSTLRLVPDVPHSCCTSKTS